MLLAHLTQTRLKKLFNSARYQILFPARVDINLCLRSPDTGHNTPTSHQSQSSYRIPEAAQYASVYSSSPYHPQYTL